MTRQGETTSVAYGQEHQQLRRDLEPVVESGTVECWRCGQLIAPDDEWDLGHDDDRQVVMGAEHRDCNRAAGWAKLTEQRQAALRRPRTSREW